MDATTPMTNASPEAVIKAGALLSCTTITVPDFGDAGIGDGGGGGTIVVESAERGFANKEGLPLLLIIS